MVVKTEPPAVHDWQLWYTFQGKNDVGNPHGKLTVQVFVKNACTKTRKNVYTSNNYYLMSLSSGNRLVFNYIPLYY